MKRSRIALWIIPVILAAVTGALVLYPFMPRKGSKQNTILPCPYNSDTPHYDSKRGIFIFRGSYREIGRQFAAAIPMENYLKQSRNYINGLDAADKRLLSGETAKAKKLLGDLFLPALEMMLGIQDMNPGCSLDEIILLNYRTTLTKKDVWNSCSALAFLENGKIILGQNLDLGPINDRSVAYIIPRGGLAFYAHMNPPYLWFTTAVNEAGLCVGGSSTNINIVSEDNINGELLPMELVLFYLFSQARNVDEAMDLLQKSTPRGPCGEGVNLILGDSSGTLVNIEVTCDKLIQNIADDSLIATNYFRTPELAGLNLGGAVSSRLRYKRAMKWLGKNPKGSRLGRFLRDTDSEGAWCRLKKLPDFGYTSASYIINFNQGNFEYWIGTADSEVIHGTLPLQALYLRRDIGEVPPP